MSKFFKVLFLFIMCTSLISSVSASSTLQFLFPANLVIYSGASPEYWYGPYTFYWSGIGPVYLQSDAAGSIVSYDNGVDIYSAYGTLSYWAYWYHGKPDISSICRPGYNSITLYGTSTRCCGVGPETDFYLYYDDLPIGFSINGYVEDQSTGLPISGATVSAEVAGVTVSDTTDSSGFYNIILSSYWELSRTVTVTASATGYKTKMETFVALSDAVYNVNFNLAPLSTPHSGTAIQLFVYDNRTYDAVSDVMVTASGEIKTTDSYGIVTFEDLDVETEYSFTTYADGYHPNTSYITTGIADELTVEYIGIMSDKEYTYNVTVAGYTNSATTGYALPSVNVSIKQNNTFRNITSDVNGLYIQPWLDYNYTIYINYTKSGYLPANYTFTPIDYTLASEDGDLYIINVSLINSSLSHTGTSITGIAYDTTTGDGVSGAYVRLYNSTWTSEYNTTTDYGLFLFNSLLPSSSYTLEANAFEYFMNTTSVTSGTSGSLSAYNIGIEPVSYDGESMLCHGYIYNITALIEDEPEYLSDVGIPYAKVKFEQPEISSSSLTTFTNASGYYIISGLDNSTYINVEATHSSYQTETRLITEEAVEDYIVYTLSIGMVPTWWTPFSNGSYVFGQVIDNSTTGGLNGCSVRAYNGTWTSEYNGTTNYTIEDVSFDGYFFLDTLVPNETYTVEGYKMGYLANTSTVTMPSGLNEGCWTYIYMDLSNVEIFGWIVDAETISPVTSATCSFKQGSSWYNSTTNSSGGYHEGRFVPDVRIDMYFGKTGYYGVNGSYTPLVNDRILLNLSLMLIPENISHYGPTIIGTVLDYNNLSQINGALVSATSRTTGTVSTNYTNSYGFFKVENLEPDTTYDVVVSKSGYYDSSGPVTTEGLEDVVNVNIVYLVPMVGNETNVTVFGYVYDAWTSQKITSAYVNISQSDYSSSTLTDITGRYVFTNLTEDNLITVTSGKSGYWSQSHSFTPYENGGYQLDFYLILGGPNDDDLNYQGVNLTGYTYDAYNTSYYIPAATVNISQSSTTSNLTTNESGGYFTYGYVKNDYIWFDINHPLYYNFLFWIYPEHNGTKTGNYGLLPTGHSWEDVNNTYGVNISGYLFDVYNDNRVTSAYMGVTQSATPYDTTSDSSDGTYEITGLTRDEEISFGITHPLYYTLAFGYTPPHNGSFTANFGLIPNGLIMDDINYTGVNISGYLKNIVNETIIESANVNMSQVSTLYNTTTNASGWFESSDWIKNYFINTSFNATNYKDAFYYVNPLHNGTYTYDYYMVPDDVTHDGTSIIGVVYNSTTGDMISSALVKCYNETWISSYNTTTSTGMFQFDSLLNNSIYNVEASATGYTNYTNNTINIGDENSITFVSMPLDPIYDTYNGTTIIGIVYNISNGTPITGALVKCFNMTWISEYNITTTSGFFAFENLESGSSYNIEASATGYINASNSSVPTTDTINVVYIGMTPILDFETYNGTTIYGMMYDIASSMPVEGGTVVLRNTSWSSTNTTPTSGVFVFDSLLESSSYDLDGIATGYLTTNLTASTSTYGTFTQANVPMDPIDTIPHNGTTIMGVVYSLPFYEGVDNATVVLNNLSWSTTNYSSSTGFFMFDQLGQSVQYMLTGSKTNYVTDTETATTGVVNSTTIAYLYLNRYYNATFLILDITSGARITDDVDILVDGSSLYNTSTGIVIIPTLYGSHSFLFSSSSYVSETVTDVIYSDTNTTVYLRKSSSDGGLGYRYPPVSVELQFVDQYFYPLSGLYVQMEPINTTTGGNWSALKEIYGVTDSTYYNPQTTVSGISDSNGVTIFPSLEPIYYKLTATGTHPTSGETVSYSSYIQAKSDRKVIVLHVGASELRGREVDLDYNVTGYYINDTAYRVNITYHNTGSNTSIINCYIAHQNGTVIDEEEYLDTPTCTYNYDFIPEAGANYYYGIEATHNDYGTFKVQKSFTGQQLIDIPGVSSEYYNWIAIAILGLVGAIFSAYSVRFGAIVIPLMAAFLNGIGWISFGPAGWLIIATLTLLGILAYIRKSEHKI